VRKKATAINSWGFGVRWDAGKKTVLTPEEHPEIKKIPEVKGAAAIPVWYD